ncbi:hypothetical protein BurJ1DRAFT_1348 [Burkholderiales bacterium JOSHI_001]|nr:hypothetical protein BurJ1DRAFT_1348 [Burkholderiales bacterium JOSHI_001]
MTAPRASPSDSDDDPQRSALLAAVQAVLTPLAQLALARGLPFGTLEELLKQAFVDEADRAHADLLPHRRVSRVSTATGIHRREVTRLIQELREGRLGHPREKRSVPNEVVAHWLTDPRFRDRHGQPLKLPRNAPPDGGPSFEELAHSVTRDVHPRSLLDELLRRNMARLDGDVLCLQRDAILPRGDQARMLRVLGTNVGAHLHAAVDNVQSSEPRHLERALFANGLTARSLDEVRTLVEVQWQALVQSLVPAVEAMVQRDRDAADATHEMRLGLYHYGHAPPPPPMEPPPPVAPDAARKPAAKRAGAKRPDAPAADTDVAARSGRGSDKGRGKGTAGPTRRNRKQA